MVAVSNSLLLEDNSSWSGLQGALKTVRHQSENDVASFFVMTLLTGSNIRVKGSILAMFRDNMIGT